MPKQASDSPILDFTVDGLKELKGVSVRSSLHDMITKYIAYVDHAKGQKPDKSSVVDKALEYSFSKDTGFQKFLKNGVPAKSAGSAPQRAAESAS